MLGASAHVTVVLSDPHSGTVSHMDKTNKQMDATAEIGRNPASKHHIQPEYFVISKAQKECVRKTTGWTQHMTTIFARRLHDNLQYPSSRIPQE